jgi:threonine aldolase
MRRAIAEAAVGDEQKREDPSVNELQARVAALLGQEAAIFVPTATMANQIAREAARSPGDVLIAEETAHVVIYEYGGTAAHAGLMTLGLRAIAAADAEQVTLRRSRAPRSRISARPCSLSRTRTTRRAARVAARRLDAVVSTARELELECTSTALGSSTRRRRSASSRRRSRARFDTVTLCLSKGSAARSARSSPGLRSSWLDAWREKHLFGGAMRQAGIVAAAGLYALDHHVDAAGRGPRTRAEARGVAGRRGCSSRSRAGGDELRADRRRTPRPRRPEALARLVDAGVGLSTTIHPTVMRAVTHLDVTTRTSRARRS